MSERKPAMQNHGAANESMAEDGRYQSRPVNDEALALGLVNVLLRRRSLLIVVPLVLLVAAATYRLLQPRQYTATAAFMPQRQSASPPGLSGIAAQFGITMPNTDRAESPAFYADLIESRAILEPLVATTFSVAQGRRQRSGTVLELLEIKGAGPIQRRAAAYQRLRRDIVVRTSRTTDIVRVSVAAPWPSLAEQMTARILELVNRFNLNARQSQAGLERQFVESRMDEARRQLAGAEANLQEFLQRNRDFRNSPQLVMTHDRLEREVDWRQQVFTSLAQSYEESRIDEVRNTPVITIMEPPAQPARPDGRGTVKWGLMAVVFGFILAVLYAFVTEFSKVIGLREGDEYREFAQLRSQTFQDLRRPWQLLGLSRVRAFDRERMRPVNRPDAHAGASDD
jgi:uncharacterized protein involved in exopolysaccharide biosynthesis